MKRLEKNTPEEGKRLSSDLYKMVPKISLPDLLLEVSKTTNFHSHFLHAANQQPVESFHDITVLIFAIMGLGTNVGLSKISESLNNISYKQLAHAADWKILKENVINAQASMVNYQLKEPLAKFWGNGTTSSSDGMRVKTTVNALNTSYNPHFGYDKGITIYRFVDDKYSAFYSTTTNTNNRDSLHVIDGLLKHKSELQIKEHYTDTAGYTDQVFALMSLMGFHFAPRLRNLTDLKLFSFDKNKFPKLNNLVSGLINTDLIKANYDNVLRLSHSIFEGKVSSALILGKLGSYSRNNTLANALKEMGRSEKTIFILEYASDPELRRRIQIGLNKGEELNGLARAVFFGRRGQFWEHEFQAQFQKSSCLNIILNAIVIWNTKYLIDCNIKYLTKAWNHYIQENPETDETLLKHISPLNWEHINFLGEYSFDVNVQFETDNLRKLNI